MVNFPTCIPHCDSHSPALLDLSFSSKASICSTMAFSPLVNFDHVVISVSIDFLSNLKKDAPLQSITYDYSCVDWDGLHDHLRDVPQENIFKFHASATATEFCEWVQALIDVYIPHHKYQVKPHSFPWFLAACAAATIHRNHFFGLYQQYKSSESKLKFRQVGIHCKRVLSKKVILLFLLYSMAQRCYLLYLIKQNCLLKTFIRTLILTSQVLLYVFSFLELM